ncbi:hypothetical protein ES703_66603 [subsurface metagenome]
MVRVVPSMLALTPVAPLMAISPKLSPIWISSEKVALTAASMGTSAAASVGEVLTTIGGVMSTSPTVRSSSVTPKFSNKAVSVALTSLRPI